MDPSKNIKRPELYRLPNFVAIAIAEDFDPPIRAWIHGDGMEEVYGDSQNAAKYLFASLQGNGVPRHEILVDDEECAEGEKRRVNVSYDFFLASVWTDLSQEGGRRKMADLFGYKLFRGWNNNAIFDRFQIQNGVYSIPGLEVTCEDTVRILGPEGDLRADCLDRNEYIGRSPLEFMAQIGAMELFNFPFIEPTSEESSVR